MKSKNIAKLSSILGQIATLPKVTFAGEDIVYGRAEAIQVNITEVIQEILEEEINELDKLKE